MKSTHKVLLGSLFLLVLFSLNGLITHKVSTEQLNLRLAHTLDTEHTVHKALIYFQEQLASASSNQLTITVYPSEQLGSEKDMIELVQIGSLAMTKVSAGPLEAFDPSMKIFGLPYIFRDKKHYWDVLNSDIGETLLSAPEKVGLKGIGYFESGSRSFYTCPKAVHSPDDLKGMKIRSLKSQSAVNLLNAMGAAATPISFGELYSALQQGVVDGAENNAISYYTSKHYEVCKHYTLDQHNRIPDIILISKKVWDGLTQKQQKWITTAMKETIAFQRSLWDTETELTMNRLNEAGVDIIYPDTSLFENKVKDYKLQFSGTPIGNLLEQIESL